MVQKISNFAGSGAQEVAEFFTSDVGGTGAKFGRTVVSKGKKVANRRGRPEVEGLNSCGDLD